MKTGWIWQVLGGAFLFSGVLVAEETAERLHREAEESLTRQKAAYAEWRDQLAGKKIPLLEELSEKRRMLATRRDEWEALRAERQALADEIRQQEETGRAMRRFGDELEALLDDYRERAALHWPIAEWAHEDLFWGIDNGDEMTWRQTLETARQRLTEKVAGGREFSGSAVGPDGRIHRGTWRVMGPLMFFRDLEGTLFGYGDSRAEGRWPGLSQVEDSTGELAVWWRGENREVRIDPTGGRGWEGQARVGFMTKVKQGGPVMIPILALGLVSILVALGKFWQLRRYNSSGKHDLEPLLEYLLEAGENPSARLPENLAWPLGELASRGVEDFPRDRDLVEELLYERYLRIRPTVERFLPFLALTAMTAPLFGLLGTVTGMITTFEQITLFGTGEPRVLSGGISEALLTTQFGLMVAVPALLVHAFLQRRAKAALARMEEISARLINRLALRGYFPPTDQ